MCGGGGGLLGGIFSGVSKVLFGSPEDKGITFNAPAPTMPAPPAPSRKVDTGATVVVGAENVDERTAKRKTPQRSVSSLGLGGSSGLNI